MAGASSVSLPSIQRLETKPGPLAAQSRTVAAIRSALESAGVIFVESNGFGPGVRLRERTHGAAESAAKPQGAPGARHAPSPEPEAPPAHSAAYEAGREAFLNGMSSRWLPPECSGPGREAESADFRAGYAMERDERARLEARDQAADADDDFKEW